jgi:predicted nucleic acid-binding protein
MAEVVLDANVLVGFLDKADVHNARAVALLGQLKRDGHVPLILDVLVAEAISVICRRAQERRAKQTDLRHVTSEVRSWHGAGAIANVSADIAARFDAILDVVDASDGVINFNDALLVVLQREGAIGVVASFDKALDTVPDFQRTS